MANELVAETEETDLYDRPEVPLVVVISGPSGVGKDTLARMLLEHSDSFYFVVTATTRPPRQGEAHGKDYFFVTNDEFAAMIEAEELLEYAHVYNDFKGIPKQQIREALASGLDVIMRLDVQGAATIRKLIPNAIFVFLIAETESEMVRRLRERKSETSEGLRLRIATARQEMKRMAEFEYVVINAESRQEQAVAKILAIIDANHARVHQTAVKL